MNENHKKVAELYDGERTSKEIAEIVGLSPRYVRRIAKNLGLSRRGPGARRGELNHQFVCGRRIDRDGYVLVTAPEGHPNARKRPDRKGGAVMFEHRLVMENKLGRYLRPGEVVDHIDGLTLHNDPTNLRLYQTNGDHLHGTISGTPRHWSKSGRQNTLSALQNSKKCADQRTKIQRVDIYRLRRERGDVRLRRILLAAFELGIDSPYLLGTHRHLERAQIDWKKHPNLKRAWDELCERWERDLDR